MRILLSALAAALLLAASPAPCAEVDLRKLSCADLLSLDEDTATILMTWSHGYLSAPSNQPRLSLKDLAGFTDELGDWCQKNPKRPVMEGAEAVGPN